MATKNKGGRPPRAPGERMTRLSVMLRPIYREGLELLAREQRTSISQALEGVLARALRSNKIGDRPLLEVAQEMVFYSPDTVKGRMNRIAHQPFKTPDEEYAAAVIDEVKSGMDMETFVESMESEWKARLLMDMIDDSYSMGGEPEFCAKMFKSALQASLDGAPLFTLEDHAGITFTYILDDYINNPK